MRKPLTICFVLLALLSIGAGLAAAKSSLAKASSTKKPPNTQTHSSTRHNQTAIKAVTNSYVEAIFKSQGTLGCSVMSINAQKQLLEDVEVYITQQTSNQQTPIISCPLAFTTLLAHSSSFQGISAASIEQEISKEGKIAVSGNIATLSCPGHIPWDFIKQNDRWLINENILFT